MSEKDKHKSTYYSGKKPYLTHNYRTMMKKKTAEEYYFHEMGQTPMSELHKPYWHDPDLPGFTGWEYVMPGGWKWPPYEYPSGGPGGGVVGPFDDDDGLGPGEGCTECQVVGPSSVQCGDAWIGQVIPSQCAGIIQFAMGLDESEDYEVAGTASGALVVAVPADAQASAMLVCNSGGPDFPTCCMEVAIECCCANIELTGSPTQGVGTTWTGIVSPACTDAICDVTSNSGCTLSCQMNEAGSEVTVAVGGGDCGSFTVTVTEEASPTCAGSSDSVTVQITGNGGDWKVIPDSRGCGGPETCGAGCNIGYYAPCVQAPYKYGTGDDPWTGNNACRDNWSRQCKGCGGELPCCSNNTYPPPCDTYKNCLAGSHHYCDNSPCSEGGDCCCANHGCWICEWKCTC